MCIILLDMHMLLKHIRSSFHSEFDVLVEMLTVAQRGHWKIKYNYQVEMSTCCLESIDM